MILTMIIYRYNGYLIQHQYKTPLTTMTQITTLKITLQCLTHTETQQPQSNKREESTIVVIHQVSTTENIHAKSADIHWSCTKIQGATQYQNIPRYEIEASQEFLVALNYCI
ncbi:hypothetical protein OTU49_001512 [Cherax quadricarinatus]|uniref:Uncharacterized protein n=1 Tax=Cherax quadricarinatus TaxID=27406 RepID=A0AAW0XRL0_CHEQU